MTAITFAPGLWENAGLRYAYSWRFEGFPTFRQEADCIINSSDPAGPAGYDYLGMLSQTPLTEGDTLRVRTSFEGSAAPMITLCDRYEIDENGVLRTLDYYELVIWKNGLNVWRMHTQERKVSFYKALGLTFPLEAGQPHMLSVTLEPQHLHIRVDDHAAQLYLPDMPASFLGGYTACEGLCRLYDMEIAHKST